MTALAIMEKVLAGQIAVGFQMPFLLWRSYGADFILEVEEMMREDLNNLI